MQDSPMLRILATMAPSTATSRSASAHTIRAALPPSSMEVRSTLSAACRSSTRSTEVGRVLLRQAADNVLRTSMELGGNAALIVCADADLDVAVDGAMVAKMRNIGESCVAANRISVEEPVRDRPLYLSAA